MSVPGPDPANATSVHGHLWRVSVSLTRVPFHFSWTPVVGGLVTDFQTSQ